MEGHREHSINIVLMFFQYLKNQLKKKPCDLNSTCKLPFTVKGLICNTFCTL